jgi:hypothetical protein
MANAVTTVILSQWSCPSPYWLSQNRGYTWAEFLQNVKDGEFARPKITDEAEPRVPDASLAFREGPDGTVTVWRSNLDSSD